MASITVSSGSLQDPYARTQVDTLHGGECCNVNAYLCGTQLAKTRKDRQLFLKRKLENSKRILNPIRNNSPLKVFHLCL